MNRPIPATSYGEWFRPSSPTDRIAGVLKYQEGAAELTLISPYSDAWRAAFRLYPEVLLGVTSTGARVSLWRCSYSSGHGWGGIEVTSLRVQVVLWGTHAAPPTSLVPDSVIVDFAQLHNWVDQEDHHASWGERELTRRLQDNEWVLVDTAELRVAVQSWTTFTDASTRLNVEDRSQVSLRLRGEPLDAYVFPIRVFRTLLVLGTTGQTGIGDVTGRQNSDVTEYAVTGLLQPVKRDDERDQWHGEMLFTLRGLLDAAPNFVSTWFEGYRLLESPLTLYAFTAHRNDIVMESAFLNIARACEGFHRIAIGGHGEEPAARAERLERIYGTCSKDDAEWLRRRFKYDHNEPTFARRLTELWDRCGEGITSQFRKPKGEPSSRDGVIHRTVNARNFLTHPQGESPPDLSELPTLTRWWTVMLEANLMLHFGAPAAFVTECFERQRSVGPWQFLSSRNVDYRPV